MILSNVNLKNLLVSQERKMSVIEKIRDIWERYGGGFNSLAPCEQVEILWRAWVFAAVCGILACIGTLIVTVARLVEFLT